MSDREQLAALGQTLPTDAEKIQRALLTLKPLLLFLPQPAQFVVAEAVAVLERELAPADTQDTVTPRPAVTDQRP